MSLKDHFQITAIFVLFGLIGFAFYQMYKSTSYLNSVVKLSDSSYQKALIQANASDAPLVSKAIVNKMNSCMDNKFNGNIHDSLVAYTNNVSHKDFLNKIESSCSSDLMDSITLVLGESKSESIASEIKRLGYQIDYKDTNKNVASLKSISVASLAYTK